MSRPRVGVAVLTMGDRPDELRALLASVGAQSEPATRVVVVGNGCRLPGSGPRGLFFRDEAMNLYEVMSAA